MYTYNNDKQNIYIYNHNIIIITIVIMIIDAHPPAQLPASVCAGARLSVPRPGDVCSVRTASSHDFDSQNFKLLSLLL